MTFLSSIFGYVLNFFYELICNYGVSIIIFSVLLRLVLIPITIKQQKTMKKSAKMQEKMKEIQEKYRNNPEKLNQETMNLYRTEGMSPFSGCFSAILQLLIILSVFWLVSQPLTYMKKVDKEVIESYKTKIAEESNGQIGTYPEIKIIAKIEEEYQQVVEKIEEKSTEENIENKNENENESKNENVVEETISNEQINEETQTQEENEKTEKSIDEMTLTELESKKDELQKMRINMEFLGLDLSKVLTQNLGDWKAYVIPVLYVITSFISIKITINAQKKAKAKKNTVIDQDGKPVDTSDEMADSMNQMSNTMLYMMPIMSISIAAIAPLGLALYWLVSNILIIIERIVISKFIKTEEEEENE